MLNCERCGNDQCGFAGCVDEETCTQYKPKTRGDGIRGMTDEELADWLIMNGDGSDYQIWLEWLKEEVNDADTG